MSSVQPPPGPVGPAGTPYGLDQAFHAYMVRLGKKNPALIDQAQRLVNGVYTLMRTH